MLLQRTLFVIAIILSNIAFSQPKSAYGPTRYAQSLWEIAAEIRPNHSVGITQLVFALHELNPKAFKAGNMNQLKRGVFLTLPDMKKVALIPIKRIKHELGRNDESLNILRDHAKKLKIAKNNKNKWADKVTFLQQKLDRLEPDSHQWVVTFASQGAAELEHRKWTAEANKIRHLLLKKKRTQQALLTHKTSVQNKMSKEKSLIANDQSQLNTPSPEWAQIDKRTLGMESKLIELQNQMDQLLQAQQQEAQQRSQQIADLKSKLEQANQQLEQKVKQLALTEARMSVLERELGDKEKIVLALRSTLRTAANTMRQQQQENQKLYARLRELNAKDELLVQKNLDLTGSNALETERLEQDIEIINKSKAVIAESKDTERQPSQSSNTDDLLQEQRDKVVANSKYQLNDTIMASNISLFVKNNILLFTVFLISLLLFAGYVILKWRRKSFFNKRKVVEIKFKPIKKNNRG
jgi:FimV-like protein